MEVRRHPATYFPAPTKVQLFLKITAYRPILHEVMNLFTLYDNTHAFGLRFKVEGTRHISHRTHRHAREQVNVCGFF